MGRKPLTPTAHDGVASDHDSAGATGRTPAHRPADRRIHLPGDLVDVESKAVVRGSQLGATYVRMRTHAPFARPFQSHGPDTIEATEAAIQPRSRAGRVAAYTKRALMGQRLPNAAAIHERLTKVKALAVLSSDAISSVAYATEASLGVRPGSGWSDRSPSGRP